MASKQVVVEVTKFLLANPKPSDSEMHEWAKGKGLDIHDVEAVCYELAAKFIAFMNSGNAKKVGFTKGQADPEQLKMGIKVEMEHTDDPVLAEKITLDHLSENRASNKKYYTKLDGVEKELEAEDKKMDEEEGK